MAHGNRLRSGRVSEIGRVYLVTTVTLERTPIFLDFQRARCAILELRRCDALDLSRTLAFVLMPDHLHWLVELRDGSLCDLVQRFKSVSAKNINVMEASPGRRLWQAGFHDHALRDEDDLHSMARYVVANPLRAGIVRAVRDYPHWDAVWL